VAGAGAAGYGVGTLINKYGIEGTEFGNNLGGMIATILASLGNDTAKEALNVTLNLDGEQIAAAVNLRNARTATRN
jgi:hypothetical protein